MKKSRQTTHTDGDGLSNNWWVCVFPSQYTHLRIIYTNKQATVTSQIIDLIDLFRYSFWNVDHFSTSFVTATQAFAMWEFPVLRTSVSESVCLDDAENIFEIIFKMWPKLKNYSRNCRQMRCACVCVQNSQVTAKSQMEKVQRRQNENHAEKHWLIFYFDKSFSNEWWTIWMCWEGEKKRERELEGGGGEAEQ